MDSIVKRIIDSLGEPNTDNTYTLKVIDGQWWIEHKHVGSAEPVEQWLKSLQQSQGDSEDFPDTCEYIDEAQGVAEYLLDSIIQWQPSHKYSRNPPSLKGWVLDIERAMRLDGRSKKELLVLIEYIFTQNTSVADFWKPNIQSGCKLRSKFDMVVGQIRNEIKRRNGHYKKTRGDEFVEKLF